MKNLRKLNRGNLKSVNGGNVCYENCPPGPYGPGPDYPKSCDDFNALPACCKLRVKVDYLCSGPL
ncbi:hypothetical protein HHL23_15770 [Chryseobacterium sp. RP-3-3]|uniref:Uncharacterized protein n=1 Tax=Chryseobacterium antibioticum TaxID=2728847 RepID=A0A7Y0FT97_9FLAO|nr:hypothetical protein [Chryseobacterium antibioticum]NML71249.1 hypothetical protein [Chryseobacterium antibioticum]